jgi:hypothetical protein
VEQIDTSSKPQPKSALKQKKVMTYKGVKIQSDNEEEAKDNSGTTSHDSADDYFNQQRRLIRSKLTNTQGTQNTFAQDDIVESIIQPTQDREWGGDEDMNEFDRMMHDSVSEAERMKEEAQRQAREEAEGMRLERLRI